MWNLHVLCDILTSMCNNNDYCDENILMHPPDVAPRPFVHKSLLCYNMVFTPPPPASERVIFGNIWCSTSNPGMGIPARNILQVRSTTFNLLFWCDNGTSVVVVALYITRTTHHLPQFQIWASYSWWLLNDIMLNCWTHHVFVILQLQHEMTLTPPPP